MMRSLVAALAAASLLAGCGGEPQWVECQHGVFTDDPDQCGELAYRVALATSFLYFGGFDVDLSEVNIYQHSEKTIMCGLEVAGGCKALGRVDVTRDGLLLLHELLHVYRDSKGGTAFNAHAGWNTNGYYSMSNAYMMIVHRHDHLGGIVRESEADAANPTMPPDLAARLAEVLSQSR